MTAFPILSRPATSTSPAGSAFLALPFDALRLHYAGAVMAGLVPRSIVDAGRVERALDTLERLILGPLSRTR